MAWLTEVAMAAVSLSAGQTSLLPHESAARGRALFTGSQPLAGRIREHRENMPAAVVACGSCHAVNKQTAFTGTDAPALRASWLMERRVRRNGPVSAYDAASFCKVLRTGLDPVSILVDHTMPVYTLTDADCASLWLFLDSPETK